jgi:hypothetical protein
MDDDSKSVVRPRSEFIQWLIKGTLGGIVGILVTIGLQQVSDIRERQKMARLLLAEAVHNLALSESLASSARSNNYRTGSLPEVKYQQRAFEALLSDVGLLETDVVELLYRCYQQTASIEAGTKAAATIERETEKIQPVIESEFGPEAAKEFNSLPDSAKRMMTFQAYLNKADRINKASTERIARIHSMSMDIIRNFKGGIVQDVVADPAAEAVERWKALIPMLRKQAERRVWLNWFE